MPVPYAEKYCIIGAGSSGLAAAKNFLAEGIPFDCLEREDDVGGNWYFGKPASSVYASTHLISSKRLTEYPDFPMPAEWPEFPSHELALQYLRNYARHFGLYEQIEFSTAVESIEPVDPAAPNAVPSDSNPLAERTGDGAGNASRKGWCVRLGTGEERRYRGVVIANGHNWDPRWPDYEGEFSGQIFHSSQYKKPAALRDQRVLVVGGGNSGCDLAVEAAAYARSALWSTRRSYPILPKFFRGKPIDQCGELMLWLRMPLWARRAAAGVISNLVLGPAWRTGVPRPDHRLFESHPIINSQIHHRVGHGDLQLRRDVRRLDGSRVEFVDGAVDEVDVIIYATGFRLTIPFIDRTHLNWRGDAPRLHLNIFPPQRDDLFCLGFIQPASGQWGLVDCQAQLVARYIRGLQSNHRGARRLQSAKRRAADGNGNDGIHYLPTPRHALEVEPYSYRRRLKKLIASIRRPN